MFIKYIRMNAWLSRTITLSKSISEYWGLKIMELRTDS